MTTVLLVDYSWIDFPMLLFCNFKNSGHGARLQPVSSSAATPVLRPRCIERSLKRAGDWHRFVAGCFWKCIQRQHKICQFLKVSGLAFIEAKRSNCTRAGQLDSNTRSKRNTGLYFLTRTVDVTYFQVSANVAGQMTLLELSPSQRFWKLGCEASAYHLLPLAFSR